MAGARIRVGLALALGLALAPPAGADPHRQAALACIRKVLDVPATIGREGLRQRLEDFLDQPAAQQPAAARGRAYYLLGKLVPEGDGLERCVDLARQEGLAGLRADCLLARAAGHLGREVGAYQPFLEDALEAIRESQQAAASWQPDCAWADWLHLLWGTRQTEEAWRASHPLLTWDATPEAAAPWRQAARSWITGRLLGAAHSLDGLGRAFEAMDRLRTGEPLAAGTGDAAALLRGLDPQAGPREEAPADGASFLSDEPHRLAAAQAALEEGAAILAYRLLPWEDLLGQRGGGAWLMVATHRWARVHRVRDPDAVLEQARRFDPETASDGPAVELEVLRDLYGHLVRPGIESLRLQVGHLILVPGEELAGLPWHALRPAAFAAPLEDRFRLSTTASVRQWLARKVSPRASRAWLYAALALLPLLLALFWYRIRRSG